MSTSHINWEAYRGPPGREHYRLLEELSKSFENREIFDIGTWTGASAYALAQGKNQVYSFDIEHRFPLLTIPNVSYHLDDLTTEAGREKWKDKLLGSAFIMLDIDPHEGVREYEFYCWLRDNDYKGFVVCDDIWLFREMRDNFWKKVPDEHKIDVSHRGHHSGTGIIRFHRSAMWP